MKALKKSDRTKQFIIEQAAILFNQKGFAATSMQDIMQNTKLSKGALYGHFKTKEAIALAAFHQAVKTVKDDIRTRTRVIDHAIDKLKAVVYYYKEHILHPAVKGGCPIQNTAVDTNGDSNTALRLAVQEVMDAWRSSICKNIEQGVQSNEIRTDIDAQDFAIRFIAVLQGGILMANLYKDASYFVPSAQLLIEMIEKLKMQQSQNHD